MKIKHNLTLDDFRQMFELEKRYYSLDCITPVDQSYLWYRHFEKSFLVAVMDREVIGFMCLFPIRNYICDELERGCFNDADLEFTDIISEDELKVGGVYTLFLSCIVVDEAYRDYGVLKLLLNGYRDYYEGLRLRGVGFDFVLSDNVTEAGLEFSKGMGLEVICESVHDSTVVKGAYDCFLSHIRS